MIHYNHVAIISAILRRGRTLPKPNVSYSLPETVCPLMNQIFKIRVNPVFTDTHRCS